MIDAKVQGHARARQSNTDAQRAYKDGGDYESERNVLKEGIADNVWLPEEGEAIIATTAAFYVGTKGQITTGLS